MDLCMLFSPLLGYHFEIYVNSTIEFHNFFIWNDPKTVHKPVFEMIVQVNKLMLTHGCVIALISSLFSSFCFPFAPNIAYLLFDVLVYVWGSI